MVALFAIFEFFFFFAITSRISRIPTEDIELKDSLDSELQFESMSSTGILSFLEVITEPSFFRKSQNVQPWSQYTYQIQMKNQSGSVFEREFTSEFEAGKCRGYHLFCPLDRLDQYIENNQLRFIFYVR